MLTLEHATENDADLLYEFEQAEDAKQFIIPYSSEKHASNIKNSELIYLKIISSNQVVGFIILAIDESPDTVEFRRIVIGNKGLGLGQKAIQAMEEFCVSELSRSTIWLDVFVDNLIARHIYEKLSYIRFGQSKVNEEKLLLYRKKL